MLADLQEATFTEARYDGYYDAFIGRGVSQYTLNSSYFERKALDQQLTDIYENALARRIVTSLIDDCVKNWLTVKGDREDRILQYLETIEAEKAFVEAGYWDRLYGRSCIFILADDGQRADEPVNLRRLISVKGFAVFDKRDIVEDMSGLLRNDDPSDPNFGRTEYYTLMPETGAPFTVHHSRLLMFDGETLPRRERIANSGAGLSCLDGVIKAIRRNDTAHARALDILERLSQSMLKLDGLSGHMATKEGTDMVRRRLDMIDTARNLLNTIAIDREDDFQLYHMNVAGVKEVIQEFQQEISGMTGIPVTILFGRSPGGENSTGAADFENYYNAVRRYQKTRMKPQLEKLVKLVQYAKDGPTGGRELDDWQIIFNPLKQLDEREEADLATARAQSVKLRTDTLKSLLDMGLMSEQEARSYLFKECGVVPDEKLPEKPKEEEQGGAAGKATPEGPQDKADPEEQGQETPEETDAGGKDR